jgi:small subunit ribosomal protein S17
MEKKKTETRKRKAPEIVGADCHDINCPFHGELSVRGRGFEGKVVRKFHKRIAIEFERTIYIKKYERYSKVGTRIHARLPTCMEKSINVGDFVRIQECRPLSKIIHFVVISKIHGEEKQ